MADRNGPVARSTAAAIRRVIGREPEFICSPGTYDQKHIDRIGKLRDCIAYGPGILDLAHQPDEYRADRRHGEFREGHGAGRPIAAARQRMSLERAAPLMALLLANAAARGAECLCRGASRSSACSSSRRYSIPPQIPPPPFPRFCTAMCSRGWCNSPRTVRCCHGSPLSWDISDDGLTYVFHLIAGVRFHDGSAFDAAAAKYSLERIIAPGSINPQRSRFGAIRSVEIVDPIPSRSR